MTTDVPAPTIVGRSIWLAAVLLFGSLVSAVSAKPAGSLDAGFNVSQVQGDRVNAIAVQSDGNIIVAGTLSEVDGVPRSLLARVHRDGTLDPSFIPPAIQSYNMLTDATITTLQPDYVPIVFAVAVEPDGKVLVGGSFYFVEGQPGYGGLIRLNTDGSVDDTFHAPRFSGSVFAVVPLSDGSILVGGDFSYVNGVHQNSLAKLDSAGRLVSSFNPGAFAGTLTAIDTVSDFPTVHAIGVQADGSIVVGGIFTSIGGTPRRALAQLTPGGAVDTSFVPDANFDPVGTGHATVTSIDQVLTLVVQADGKIVVGGNFKDPVTGDPSNSVYRLDTDGTLDPSFNPGGTGTAYVIAGSPSYNGIVNAMALEPAGKIILAGEFLAYNGVTEVTVARLDADGTLDTSFKVGTGPLGSLFGLALQPDGAVLVGGEFVVFDGVQREVVARLNAVPNVPPAVVATIVASEKFASSTTKGAFTVSRTGSNQTADLYVNYTVSGTAKPGVNYRALPGQVIIPGGSSSAEIKVKALLQTGGNRKVTVTLVPNAAYGVTAKPSANVIVLPAGS